jgi:HSP20 family protein
MSLIPWRQKETRQESQYPLERFRREASRLFDRFFEEDWITSPLALREKVIPNIAVTETDDEVQVRAEIPGAKPEEIDVSITQNVLNISGRKEESHETKRRGFYRAERRSGFFRRSVPLPSWVNVDNASAEYNNGVLTIHLPKDESAKPKRVPIKVGQEQGSQPA